MAKDNRRKPRYKKAAAIATRESEQLKMELARAEKAKSRIEADLTQQAASNSTTGGPLYYEDREITCKDCGRKEIWTARQQQWWYEVAKGAVYSRAVRCRACRGARRSGRRISEAP
jgi:hypothetical protein